MRNCDLDSEFSAFRPPQAKLEARRNEPAWLSTRSARGARTLMANVILPAPPAQPPLDTPDAGIQLCVGCESFGTIRVIVAAICTAILLPIMLIFVGVNLCPVRAPHSREDQAARSQAPAKARGPQWALRERACMEVSTARGQQKKLHPVSDANISEV